MKRRRIRRRTHTTIPVELWDWVVIAIIAKRRRISKARALLVVLADVLEDRR